MKLLGNKRIVSVAILTAALFSNSMASASSAVRCNKSTRSPLQVTVENDYIVLKSDITTSLKEGSNALSAKVAPAADIVAIQKANEILVVNKYGKVIYHLLWPVRTIRSIALSRDGKYLAYTTISSNKTQIYRIDIARNTTIASEIPGVLPHHISISSDGSRYAIANAYNGKLATSDWNKVGNYAKNFGVIEELRVSDDGTSVFLKDHYGYEYTEPFNLDFVLF